MPLGRKLGGRTLFSPNSRKKTLKFHRFYTFQKKNFQQEANHWLIDKMWLTSAHFQILDIYKQLY